MRLRFLPFLVFPLLTSSFAASPPDTPSTPWPHGLPRDPSFFPIAVWLQSPDHAARYQKLGINLFVGLWNGPTAPQLATLKAAGLPVICEQNHLALTDPNNDIIVGWMHGDEPDNAQPDSHGSYGPPISPSTIVDGYRRIVAADPTRPVLLNLGQGVAWDAWVGRGSRTSHPEDYPAYLQGCDLASFDIYPVTHDHPAIAGHLERVPFGVDRLRQWSAGQKPVWTCIECTHIGNPAVKPTPAQVRSEVWMALIHGARGLIYFAHEFQPHQNEAALLADPAMSAAVSDLNHQITTLAPVLNSPPVEGLVRLTSSSDPAVPIDLTVRQLHGATYLFAAAMRGQPTRATFQSSLPSATTAQVLGENRTLPITQGSFSDSFAPYAVHLYVIH